MRVKDINIKNLTYYFFDDIINIKEFYPTDIKIDEKSYKNVLIYYWICNNQKRSKNLKCKSFVPYF